MRASIYFLILFGTAGIAFGVWGLFSESGQRVFDEMDGMIPFFALVGSGLLVFLAIILVVIQIRRQSDET